MTLKFTIRSNKNVRLLALIFLIPLAAVGQKDAQFSLFSLNQLYLNPAAAGADGLTKFQLTHRTQYAGYQGTNLDDTGGALSTQLFSFSMPIKNFGIGFYALNDKSGPRTDQDFKLSAAYHIPVAGGNLQVGASAGLFRQAIDYGKLRARDPDDPLIQTGVISEINPDLAVGVRYESDAFYAGISLNHLLKPKYQLGSDQGTNPLPQTIYFNAGVNLELGYLLDIQPIVLVKSDISTLSVEGGATVTYNKRYWVGGTYRQQDSYFILMGGIYLLQDQSLRLSGAYDLVIGGDRAKAASSFEVMLSYALPSPKFGKKTIIRTPRFRF
ncbi:type IX secretion system membrane protein PorP/SprF [Dyadobacter sp. CY343]|jgi:type IX secretion system PorP/SprF family membrane protein|uniref:PorP/SprF family type IX secretion system membrane protein n=1 Tax=Dyadobacter sp. CY343 TaxID=2907299 RepID=UPI001F47A3AF|nr:type IX secretion system membrane protein PorP/SprF [Dyadobacter sp. CY343]MCE7061387.1 type IX secretion system membrane protein PorP/SprF [Dyadobacter sp. CY343]